MDKKKIIIASFFVAIMILVPFTAVATQHTCYIREKELEEESEKGSKNIECSKCYDLGRCLRHRFQLFMLFLYYKMGEISKLGYEYIRDEIHEHMKEIGCFVS